jgi:predicted  nucleic acid-binding Zn-ribbon protein
MHRKLDEVQENTNTLKIQMEEVRADIRIIKANYGDICEYLDGQFKSIEQKQGDHQELIGQLINVGE